MKSRSWSAAVAVGIASIVLAGSAQAAPINSISPGSLTGTAVIDFETLPGSLVNRDTILTLDGASFGEHFAGQAVAPAGNFDSLIGFPTGPLSLLAGAPNQNLTTDEVFGDVALYGNSHIGYPFFAGIGEGAVSVLFDIDQSQVGFDVEGANGGQGTIQFFRRDGSLIDTFVVPALANGTLAFEREGGLTDIAGISLTNFNNGGVAFDNFRVNPIPEPHSVVLFSVGFLVAGWSLRRRGIA